MPDSSNQEIAPSPARTLAENQIKIIQIHRLCGLISESDAQQMHEDVKESNGMSKASANSIKAWVRYRVGDIMGDYEAELTVLAGHRLNSYDKNQQDTLVRLLGARELGNERSFLVALAVFNPKLNWNDPKNLERINKLLDMISSKFPSDAFTTNLTPTVDFAALSGPSKRTID